MFIHCHWLKLKSVIFHKAQASCNSLSIIFILQLSLWFIRMYTVSYLFFIQCDPQISLNSVLCIKNVILYALLTNILSILIFQFLFQKYSQSKKAQKCMKINC